MVNRRKIGIKPGREFLETTTPQRIKELFDSGFSYIEYQAPVPNLKLLAEHLEISCQQLMPHSVFQSLTMAGGISHVTANRLASEIKLSKSDYLAEHIGSVNPNSPYPTHYYLYPPQLNNRTLDLILDNVQILEEIVKVPLALENSVFYLKSPKDVISYLSFLEKLDRKLPKETGWLIDVAHLVVASRNLQSNFFELVNFFKETQRPIFEIHLSSFKIDADGVTNDHHQVSKYDKKFKFAKNLAKYLSKEKTNLTFEVNLVNFKDANSLVSMYHSGSESLVYLSDLNEEYCNIFKNLARPTKQSLKAVEKNGRKRIVERQLKNIFSVAPASVRNCLLNEIFHEGVEGLASRFLDFSEDSPDVRIADYANNISGLLRFLSTCFVKSKLTSRQLKSLNLFLILLVRENLMVEIVGTGKAAKALVCLLPEKFGKEPKNVLLDLGLNGTAKSN